MGAQKGSEEMSSSSQSPEVITSIAFGIFASALGVAQLVMFFIHRKHRNQSIQTGESILTLASFGFAHNPGEIAEPRGLNFPLPSHSPSPPTSILIVAVVDISVLVSRN
jgi:hypothetical protein